jgi:branched-subunit amino acid aminotransferase/4-amino-4-deoxychorismate lyase
VAASSWSVLLRVVPFHGAPSFPLGRAPHLAQEIRVTAPAASHIWLNGRLLPSDGPHLSAYDRGFQLGDGVFEALRARRGVAVDLEGHLARLHGSMKALEFELPFGDEIVAAGIADLLAVEGWDGREPPGDAAIRITVSRGYDPARGVLPTAGGPASVAIQAWPHKPPAERVLQAGERFITSAVRRVADSPISGLKTTSRAELVYARLEAARAGADDAIFLTTDGRITEATTSNVLVIRGAVCATPRLGTGILAGTTRAWLVSHGEAVGLRMVERDLRLEDLLEADEAAVCSSIGGVIPFVSLDGRPIGGGTPGPRTIAMRAARESWIDALSLRGATARGRASGADATVAAEATQGPAGSAAEHS